MLFVITCSDKPGMIETRLANRDNHLAHLAAAGARLKLGGPFLNEQEQPVGSLLIVEAEDAAAARAFVDADPFARAGVFETIQVRPWRASVGEWAP